MKEYVILILIFITSTFHSFAENSIFDSLDYYRVYTNYNGSAYNGRTILAYGEGGVIIRSVDEGNNWSQINLNDSFNIVSITNIGNDFYGVVNKQYIIKSSDDGINWQQFDYGNNTEFYKIIAYNNNLYCISNFGIIVFNSNVEKSKEYIINADTTYYDFTITGNNLVYSAGHGKLGIINLQNDNTNIVDLKNSGICADCPVIKNLFSDGNLTYFELGNSLYQYDGSKVDFIFSPIKKGVYSSYNGNLYELYNISNVSTNLDSLYFIKIDKQNHNAIHIKKGGNDRYISSLKFKNVAYLTSDIIIAVGFDKLIYMSYNRGQNWQLKSHFNISSEFGYMFLFDKLNAKRISKYAKFIKTIDGGNTWLPQQNYEPIFMKFSDFQNTGDAYFKDNMYGFFYGNNNFDVQGDTNFTITYDGGETVLPKNVNNMIGYLENKKPLTCLNNNKTIFSLQGALYDLRYSLIFRLNDTLGIEQRTYLDSTQILYIDSYNNNELVAITATYKYPRDSVGWIFDSLFYSFLSSKDDGESWKKEIEIKFPVNKFFFDKIRRIIDNIFIGITYGDQTKYYCDVFKLNLKTMSFDKIFSKEDMNILQFGGITGYDYKTLIGGLFYTKTGYYFEYFENNEIENEPFVWNNISPKTRYSEFYMDVQQDSLIYMTAYDSLMKSDVMWFAKHKKITSVEEQIEVSNTLYISQPIPNPAQDFVKVRVYWNMSYNIENAVISVYDLLGTLVSEKKEFSFNKINNYSGELTWLSENQNSGVYLITIKIGTEIKAFPFVIAR
ncbi:MAG: hypothetical protein A2475_08790 [Ignavibacteria bacterium RIFOXYC2_FULL_35_21]|nr:MAG: hypothetical protein A2X63_00190 [Ignavibacteria bacterium GWA2_35_8]OGU93368.1 MAG: hypothetical protein A2220_13415 [Ignavibacteria bacterium RIFOXYA2_FULL_35_10]OGV18824.1 MAG: hypothetical protein A2475_08790 [Ignavibacteria bacterium RIFOXYC2_FULL_35_21]